MSLRLYTTSQDYRSHERAAQAYIDIFAQLPDSLVTLVDDPDEADACFLHMEPNKAKRLLCDIPSLKRTYCIGFCVWEAESLPKAHIKSIDVLDEVWTASLYNWRAFSQVHPKVCWMPHVTGNAPKAQADDIEVVRGLLAQKNHTFYFLCIAEDLPRKNLRGLAQAFHHVHQRNPHARLIIKTDGESETLQIEHQGPITYYRGDAPSGHIGALYHLCDAYVSAHFAEGWGLTLSDAMQHRKLCIAPGYSGNTEFMTAANSLRIDCTAAAVRSDALYYLFDTSMTWGYPHQESLEQHMLWAIQERDSDRAQALIKTAAQDIRLFDRKHIRCLVAARLRAIAMHLERDDNAAQSQKRKK